jgi:NAD(P)-dependent dehydrogenase (short-subunit alcohol dehydrogenase family)
MELKGSIALITGASSGIGLATAHAFAAVGSQVVLVARTSETLEAAANEINDAGGWSIAISVDITDRAAVRSLIEMVERRFGRLDVLVNNAGIGVNSPVAKLDVADLERVLAVNLYGPLHLIQAALPLMVTQRKGVIVNILSISGRRAMPNSGGYCASKAALELLSDSLRMEVASAGVKVVNVCPGFTVTPFASHALGELRPRGRGRRLAVPPERVARAVVKAVRREKRDSYVTLFDRAVISVTRLFPRLADWAMGRVWLSPSGS